MDKNSGRRSVLVDNRSFLQPFSPTARVSSGFDATRNKGGNTLRNILVRSPNDEGFFEVSGCERIAPRSKPFRAIKYLPPLRLIDRLNSRSRERGYYKWALQLTCRVDGYQTPITDDHSCWNEEQSSSRNIQEPRNHVRGSSAVCNGTVVVQIHQQIATVRSIRISCNGYLPRPLYSVSKLREH